ncbi:MAG: hypothetical protein V4591_07525 [Bdellovibrionota bacterium]
MKKLEDNMTIPRRCAASEIKLLRLDLFANSKSACEDIGCEWNHAQPAETLSPARAAALLEVEIWARQSVVKKRYKTLQLRYPPEQFSHKHTDLRPAYELLSNPRRRLNWFWQSGFVPLAEIAMTPREALARLVAGIQLPCKK